MYRVRRERYIKLIIIMIIWHGPRKFSLLSLTLPVFRRVKNVYLSSGRDARSSASKRLLNAPDAHPFIIYAQPFLRGFDFFFFPV